MTEQDSGQQVRLSVGQERSLRLDGSRSWDTPVVDADVVTLTPVDHLVDPGYVEWLVTGVAPGTATLQVRGEPACDDPEACAPTTVTLSLTVTG